MKPPSFQLSLAIAQLLLHQLLLPWPPVSGDSGSSRLRFARTWLCPVAEGSGLQVELLGDKMACALQCTGQPRCNAFHFQRSTGLCYLGDACVPQTQQWTAGSCASFVIEDVTPGYSVYGSSTPLLWQLQMKLFYKFKKSGLVNEANPRQFCLTAHDVTVGSDGAEFKGYSGSYLSTETPGFEQLLDYGNTYSIFGLVRSRFLSDHRGLSSFVHCNGSLVGNQLIYCNRSLCQQSNWLKFGSEGAAVFAATSVPAVQQDIHQPVLTSLGVAVNKSAVSHFYFNQSLLQPSLQLVTPGTAEPSEFQCLMLGYDVSSEGCFNGTMACYGVSSRSLMLEELQQLEAYCLAA